MTATECIAKARGLEARMQEVSDSPEKLYIVMSAAAAQYEMAGHRRIANMIRESAGKVRLMRGMEAPHAWRELSRWERFKNRKRRRQWEREYTMALEEEGHEIVRTTLMEQS